MNFHRRLFCGLLLVLGANGFAADADFFGVIKLQQYYQTNASTPLLGSNGYSFQAFVNPSAPFAVTSATVKPSNATPLRTLSASSDGSLLRFEESFTTQAALDATYPAGSAFSPVNYSVTMQTVNDGLRSANLNFFLFVLPVSYPVTPQIQNWSAAQNLDHTIDFTLSWTNLGGSSLAVVQLLVMDSLSNIVFSTPGPFQAGALNGASTSATIPAFSLPAGTNLIGHLTIANPGAPNTNSYPGAVGVPALAKDTQFTLATRPAPSAPRLDVRPRLNGNFNLRVTGEPNRRFHVEGSTALNVWTNLLTTNSATGTFDYADPSLGVTPARFYRTRIGQ